MLSTLLYGALALAGSAWALPSAPVHIKRVASDASTLGALTVTLGGNASDSAVLYVPLNGPSFTAAAIQQHALSEALNDEFGLITVVNAGKETSFAALKATIDGFAQEDDVFDEAFTDAFFIQSTSQPSSATLRSVSSTFGSRTIFSSTNAFQVTGVATARLTPSKTLPMGPYVYRVDSTSQVTFFPVYRLYPDPQEAFLYGVTPSIDGGFERSSGAVPDAGDYTTIPVPSRLYSKGSTLPLAGLRVGVKDIYDVKGLKTGCGSRAHFALYPPKTTTAPAVQRLIDQGAVIVGKTKTSQFANGETATADWVDQLCPFNPRGDGYQDPSSSSSGSGAAEGAYAWLDHAIGSDTGGSIRGPAGQQGLFGIRPSHGAITLEDVMPLSDVMDTAGYFARDAAAFNTFGKAWYGSQFSTFNAFPKILRVPNDTWPVSNLATQAIFGAFITQLAAFLGASTDTQGISSLWTATAGQNASVQAFTNQTYATLIGAYQHATFGLPFIRDYQAANGGRAPFVDPAPTARWAFAVARGADAFAEERVRREVFQDWVASEVFKADDSSCSDSLMVYPQSQGRTSYRNQYFGPPSAPLGFGYSRIAPFAGVPDVVVPLGQIAYNSTVSGQEEHLPVTISLVARKGCDYMILDLIERLAEKGIVSSVQVGQTAFPV